MSDLLLQLQKQLPQGELVLDKTVREQYAGDKWFAARVPEAVALPRTTAGISTLLQFASANKIPVTPRGAGYGYVGGCVPSEGGIALSLAAMNRIKEINVADFIAIVEPGVLTAKLQDAVERKHLFYPPDPASRSDCSIGGNIATNAGGPRCLKYGVTRDYVLGLEVVLADGQIVRLGGRTHKNKTGFDLHRLFVGSEGMLGVVTEATLKLLPLPPYRAALSVGFLNTKHATRAIRNLFAAGVLPCALELADAFTVAAAEKRTRSKMLSGCKAHLIVELDGQENSVREELKEVAAIFARVAPKFMVRALGSAACEKIWKLRREFSYALRDTGLTKLNQDIVVPRGRLEDLFRFAEVLQKKHAVPIACFGHAGDGNIHVNVMVDIAVAEARARADAALDDLFEQVLDWGGAITGEHGIGLAKKRWWPLAAGEPVQRLHHTIKNALDPAGILTPGKFL